MMRVLWIAVGSHEAAGGFATLRDLPQSIGDAISWILTFLGTSKGAVETVGTVVEVAQTLEKFDGQIPIYNPSFSQLLDRNPEVALLRYPLKMRYI